MEEQRRLLDELMGKTRNKDGANNMGRNFWDADVDKFFLAGFSPFLEFKNTKSATWLQDCYRAAFPDRPKLRSLEWEQWSRNEELKAQYDALSQSEKDKYGYEHDLMLLLDNLVQKCDNRVRAVQEDMKKKNDEILSSMSPADEKALEALNLELESLTSKVREAEASAERGGGIAQLQGLMSQVDAKHKEKTEVLRRVDIWRLENQRSVCEISGNVILPPGSKHQNIHDHEAGKQYQGWKTARQLLKRLKAQEPKAGLSSARRSASRGGTSHGGDGASERDRRRLGRGSRAERSRSRSANSSRERQRKDRSRDRRRRH